MTDNAHTTKKLPSRRRRATCPSLSKSGVVEYQIDHEDGDATIAIIGYSGPGYFSKRQVPLKSIVKTLEQFQRDYPITSFALRRFYPRTSVNSWSFLMACLLAEELVEPHPANPRCFKLSRKYSSNALPEHHQDASDL